jgi:hypothetical protein
MSAIELFALVLITFGAIWVATVAEPHIGWWAWIPAVACILLTAYLAFPGRRQLFGEIWRGKG